MGRPPIPAAAPVAPTPTDLVAEKCVAGIYGLCISNKIDLAVFITVIIGVFSYVLSEFLKWRDSRRSRFAMLVALRVEIELNVRGLISSSDKYPSFSAVSKFLREDKLNRPVTSTCYTSVIFQAVTSSLSSLPISLIDGIISFYSELDQLVAKSASYDALGFSTISDEGRESIHQDIVSRMKIAIEKGEGVKRQLALVLPSKS